MDKTTFLKTLKSEHGRWESLLAQVDESRMTQPGVSGYMSVKDIIAHVSWHEQEMIGLIQGRALAGSEWWNLPTDERNVLIFEANRDRPLKDVQSKAQMIYANLVDAIESLADEDLNNPANFRGMPADWIPWKIIAENAYEHYQQHLPDLQAWLTEQTGAMVE